MHKEFILEMKCKYPFGQLGQVIDSDTSASVCKKLYYATPQEYQQIQLIIHFMKAAQHQHLINLSKVVENQSQIELYYQYVPFKLEGWLLDVNEELICELQNQFLELADYLCRSSIKFNFNGECLGVNAEMKLKYFLDQFVIDIQNGQSNLKKLKKDIKQFFYDLKLNKTISRLREENNRSEVNQLKKSLRMGSFSTNASYSTQQDLSLLTETIMKIRTDNDKLKKTKAAQINAKLQANKRKCHQIIQRYNKMNSK